MITRQEYEEYKKLLQEYEHMQALIRADYEKIKYAENLFKCDGWRRAEEIIVCMGWVQATGADGNGPSYHDKAKYNIENVGMFLEVIEEYIKVLKYDFSVNYGITYEEYAKSIK